MRRIAALREPTRTITIGAGRDHAFGNLRVARLVSVTEKNNERSVHLLQKLGAQMREHPTKPHLVLGVIERPGAVPGA